MSFVCPLPRAFPSFGGSPCLIPESHPTDAFFQHWTGSHFAWVSLRDLGATFQLGHSHGNHCTIPSATIPLTVFDTTGIHTINVTYCECDPNGPGVPPRVQLLRARWFPATWRRPSTAFTFRFLNFLHKLQSKCKINLYDFHATMVSLSDNAGLGKQPVRAAHPLFVHA